MFICFRTWWMMSLTSPRPSQLRAWASPSSTVGLWTKIARFVLLFFRIKMKWFMKFYHLGDEPCNFNHGRPGESVSVPLKESFHWRRHYVEEDGAVKLFRQAWEVHVGCENWDFAAVERSLWEQLEIVSLLIDQCLKWPLLCFTSDWGRTRGTFKRERKKEICCCCKVQERKQVDSIEKEQLQPGHWQVKVNLFPV